MVHFGKILHFMHFLNVIWRYTFDVHGLHKCIMWTPPRNSRKLLNLVSFKEYFDQKFSRFIGLLTVNRNLQRINAHFLLMECRSDLIPQEHLSDMGQVWYV